VPLLTRCRRHLPASCATSWPRTPTVLRDPKLPHPPHTRLSRSIFATIGMPIERGVRVCSASPFNCFKPKG